MGEFLETVAGRDVFITVHHNGNVYAVFSPQLNSLDLNRYESADFLWREVLKIDYWDGCYDVYV